MKICYVDEAGCTGSLPSAISNIQPAMIIAAVVFDYTSLHHATESFMSLKRKFYPKLPYDRKRHLSIILDEIKGADLRKQAISGSRNARRHAFGFLNGVVDIVETANAPIFGRIWIKNPGAAVDGQALYTYSIQYIYATFQQYLTTKNDLGIVILDSRLKHLNAQVSHSIFTQKFSFSGDSYDRIIDLPGFAHSDNHAGLQVADLLASGIVTPMAISTYCVGHLQGVHIKSEYSAIKSLYKDRIRDLQFRHQEANGRWRGGLTVSDPLSSRSGRLLFV